MTVELNDSEKRELEEFINRAERAGAGRYYFLISAVLMLIGAFLFAYSGFMTLGKITDRMIYRVFLPGAGGSIALILLGVFLLGYSRRVAERKRISGIIQKLIKRSDRIGC